MLFTHIFYHIITRISIFSSGKLQFHRNRMADDCSKRHGCHSSHSNRWKTCSVNKYLCFHSSFRVFFKYFSSMIHFRAFIDFLIETTGVPLGAFHVIGHSSGAHIAGATGLGYREAHNFTSILPRCTGFINFSSSYKNKFLLFLFLKYYDMDTIRTRSS